MAAVINVLALPLYLRDVVFLGHVDHDSPLSGVEYGGVGRARRVRRHPRCLRHDPAAPLPLGRAMTTAPTPPGEPAADDPAFAPEPP